MNDKYHDATRQIFGIPGSQIETEMIFSIVKVLCTLHRCRLGIDNLHALVMIYNNWSNDPRDGCVFPRGNVAQYFNTKAYLFGTHEEEMEKARLFEVE